MVEVEDRELVAVWVRWILLTGAVLALAGCANLGYYLQSADGHLSLMASSRPIDRIINDPSAPEPARRQLRRAQEIRQFAIDELALPDNRSYRSYVDTGRAYVTWAVFAAPALSLRPRTWCFPVTGCVPYRGYFSEAAAERFADGLRRQGDDVYVAGIPAYSTLGFFADPLLNTMFGRGEVYVAATVFHELTHQVVYIPDDAVFNESFAVAVEETGVEKWLTRNGDQRALHQYRANLRRDGEFISLVAGARQRLQAVYVSNAGDDRKLALKDEVITDLRARYRRMRDTKWNGFSGYDRWFDGPINNAKLAPITVYSDLVPAFKRLLALCGDDYARYFGAVERLGQFEPRRRREALVGASACP